MRLFIVHGELGTGEWVMGFEFVETPIYRVLSFEFNLPLSHSPRTPDSGLRTPDALFPITNDCLLLITVGVAYRSIEEETTQGNARCQDNGRR